MENETEFVYCFGDHTRTGCEVKRIQQSPLGEATHDLHLETDLSSLLPFYARNDDLVDFAFDILDIAVSVYVADWLSHKPRQSTVRLNIEVPVFFPEIFSREDISSQLTQILFWFTGDHWSFRFKSRSLPRYDSYTRGLISPENCEVCLWSGGLDAFVGVCSRVLSDSNNRQFFLFGTGSNDYISHKQVDLCRRLNGIPGFRGRLNLGQCKIRVSDAHTISKNTAFRVRGFVFLLLGAAFAILKGQRSLYAYENGYGALNPPLTVAEVGLDHPRPVHPWSLELIQGLVASALGGDCLKISNPYGDC